MSKLIPCYPDFIPLDIGLKDELHPRLSLTSDGVSEFTFAGLYLFRDRYNYRISVGKSHPCDFPTRSFFNEKTPTLVTGGIHAAKSEKTYILSGEQIINGETKRFFSTPCAAPDWETLESLFSAHDYWKNISESVLTLAREKLEQRGVVFQEDRDNFDYLYNREELATLSGKKFHKKKNHVNQFLNAYPNHEQRPLNAQTADDALRVLDTWRANSNLREDGDFKAAKEAIDLIDVLPLKGAVFYVDGKPAAYCSGESIARGRMFAIHFEKALGDEYKGIYQFVNKAFASSLPRFFTLINREQDLGDEGLRQAKMTYRPCDFVKKWKGVLGG